MPSHGLTVFFATVVVKPLLASTACSTSQTRRSDLAEIQNSNGNSKHEYNIVSSDIFPSSERETSSPLTLSFLVYQQPSK